MGTCTVPLTKRQQNDTALDVIARAKDGDQQALAELFNTHKKRIYTLCLQMVGDVAEAEDLTQDAFIQAFRKLETFRGDSAFSTWLHRVAVNTVLMKLRRRTPPQVSYDEPISINSNLVPREYGKSDLNLMGVVDRITLARAIKNLPEGYRTIFVLHDVQGYEHGEIARLLNCSTGNSKSQLHKARLKIREFLLAERTAPAPVRRARGSRAHGARVVPIAQPPVEEGSETAAPDLGWSPLNVFELCERQTG